MLWLQPLRDKKNYECLYSLTKQFHFWESILQAHNRSDTGTETVIHTSAVWGAKGKMKTKTKKMKGTNF